MGDPQNGGPSMQDMAQDVVAAVGAVDYAPYEMNKDGYVDAFVIVHAGRGAEETNAPNDFWSVKWTLKFLTSDHSESNGLPAKSRGS